MKSQVSKALATFPDSGRFSFFHPDWESEDRIESKESGLPFEVGFLVYEVLR